jgi:hypothetical protein
MVTLLAYALIQLGLATTDVNKETTATSTNEPTATVNKIGTGGWNDN